MPCSEAQFAAFPRICRHRRPGGSWQNSPAPGFHGVLSSKIICLKFTEKPREFIHIYLNLRKFRISERSDRLHHHTRSRPEQRHRKCGEMPAPLPSDDSASTAEAEASRPPDGEFVKHANLSGYLRSLHLLYPQMRANAFVRLGFKPD